LNGPDPAEVPKFVLNIGIPHSMILSAPQVADMPSGRPLAGKDLYLPGSGEIPSHGQARIDRG